MAQALKLRRKERQFSQKRLAKEAWVSRTTIAMIEGLTEENQRPIRLDAVVRLAIALDVPVERWLRLVGADPDARRDLIESVIRDINSKREQIAAQGRGSPLEYFEGLRDQLMEPDRRALMCVSYTSRPAIDSKDQLGELIASCIKEGMSIAMTYPYSPSSPHMENRPSFSRFAWEVEMSVMHAAIGLRRAVGPKFQNRIAVFGPTAVISTAPPLQLAEYRPALVVLRDAENSTLDPQLGVWVRLGPVDPERWVTVYPIKSQDGHVVESSSEAVKTWREYFDEIIDAWTPHSEEEWNASAFEHMTEWQPKRVG